MKTKYAQSPFFPQSCSLGGVYKRLLTIHVHFIFGDGVTCFVLFYRHFNALSCQHNLQQDKSNDRKVTGQKCMKYGCFLNLFFFQFETFRYSPYAIFLEPLCRAFNYL